MDWCRSDRTGVLSEVELVKLCLHQPDISVTGPRTERVRQQQGTSRPLWCVLTALARIGANTVICVCSVAIRQCAIVIGACKCCSHISVLTAGETPKIDGEAFLPALPKVAFRPAATSGPVRAVCGLLCTSVEHQGVPAAVNIQFGYFG